MITKYIMKNYIRDNPDKFPYIYDEDEDAIYNKDGQYMSSFDTFFEIYKKSSGQSFECLFDDPTDLQSVLRCTECGTVIFTYEDERYDINLKCPTCTDYKTSFKYWTKEDIESDKDKQDILNWYKEINEYRKERDERIKRRKGKYDWEIAKKAFRGKKRYIEFRLECDDITKSYFKGLRLNIRYGKKDDDGHGYVITKFIDIPLSWSYLYIRYIYRHLGRCPADMRSKFYIGRAIEKRKNKKK